MRTVNLIATLTAGASLLSIVALAGACTPLDDDGVDTGQLTIGGSGSGDGDAGDGGTDGGDDDGDGPLCVSDLDILFVIDNSAGMGHAQSQLASDIPALFGSLDDAGVNWRAGITTTDNGNQWCVGTTPEAGNLVMSSCKSRLGDFVFGNMVDDRDLACTDVCQLSSTELEVMPTTTHEDSAPKPRPWLEHIEGKTNLPPATDLAEAFACFGPQGINGCGFESQLESAYLGLTRAQTSGEASFGFLRPGASLLVLIVSDEVDCSPNKAWSAIFASDGNKAFWSDPTAPYPTSAICWNAGVACTGDPSGYASCVAQDYDVNGAPTSSASAAVLHPLARYTGLLQAIEDQNRQLHTDARTRLALLAGVGLDGSITYADALDPSYQHQFGIGPGCESNVGEFGVPPVRMREVAEASGGALRSICAPSFADALTDIVEPFVAGCG